MATIRQTTDTSTETTAIFETIADPTPGLLAIRVSGKLDKADYARLRPWLDEQLLAHRCPSLLVLMEDSHGWENAGALAEDTKIDMAHHDDVRRVAMVGDRAWQKCMTAISAPFASAELRYFRQDELESARDWAQSGAARAPS